MAGTAVVFKEWDYEKYPSNALRDQRCREILVDLVAGRLSPRRSATDSRPIHFRMFEGMTDPGDEYFAGHYRGEPFQYLVNYNVAISMDSRVGVPAMEVTAEMMRFAQQVQNVLGTVTPLNTLVRDAHRRTVLAVGQVCALLVEFLRIHPYANGNGHIGCFVVWATLHEFGIHPRTWPLNEKIPHPYGELLSRFRNGDRAPLIRFVLMHV